MDSQLNMIRAQSRSRELAEQVFRFEGPIRKLGLAAAVTVRGAQSTDGPALQRLAELRRAQPPQAPVLIAEVGSRPLAAISLADHRIVSDPFVPTIEAVMLLKLRARQLRGGRLRALRRRLRLALPLAL